MISSTTFHLKDIANSRVAKDYARKLHAQRFVDAHHMCANGQQSRADDMLSKVKVADLVLGGSFIIEKISRDSANDAEVVAWNMKKAAKRARVAVAQNSQRCTLQERAAMNAVITAMENVTWHNASNTVAFSPAISPTWKSRSVARAFLIALQCTVDFAVEIRGVKRIGV